MKNYILSTFFFLAVMLGFVACEPKEDPVTTLTEDIKLSASSVAEGESINALRTTSITLDYSPVEVKVDFASKVTLNGVEVTARRSVANTSCVEVYVKLDPDKEYELVVPAGTVLGLSDQTRTAPKLVLHFNTRNEVTDAEISASTMIKALGFGWNLGNHFDTSFDNDDFAIPSWANGNSRYWDKAKPTQALYTNLVSYGIKTVRICATWGNSQTNNEEYTIDPAYMAEVAQNVQWALDAGMYVIVNTHHDEYWQNIVEASKSGETNKAIKNRIEKTWTQIANHFKDYSDHLIFETYNELHDNDWGWGSISYGSIYNLMDEWNQLAVDVIRATAGGNSTRWIAVPGFCASPNFTVGPKRTIKLPADPANRIIVALHTYDPYNFCTEGTVQQWGHTAPGHTDADEKEIVNLFNRIKTNLLDKGVPCYMGEFGCVVRKKADDEKYRTYFHEYFCRAAYFAGIPVMVWDNDNPGPSGEVFYYINHNDGTLRNKELVELMVDAATNSSPAYTLESVFQKAPK